MNTAKITKTTALGFIFATSLALSGAAVADSGGSHRQFGPGLSYVSQAYGPAIHSYLNLEGAERGAFHPVIVYADQAYGQAIYGYPRVGSDTVTAFNLQYVDTAFGQAIHGYPSVGNSVGEVDILPVVPD